MNTIVRVLMALLAGLVGGAVFVFVRYEIIPVVQRYVRDRWSAGTALGKLTAEVPEGGKASDLDCTV